MSVEINLNNLFFIFKYIRKFSYNISIIFNYKFSKKNLLKMAMALPLSKTLNNNNWQSKMRTLSESSKYLFNNETMSDVTFMFVNKGSDIPIQIYAHSWILSMLSPIFYNSFKTNFEVSTEIPINDTTYEVFLECLRFVYTTECTLTNENVNELMAVANKYALEFLEVDCAEFIKKSITVNSACQILDNAIKKNRTALKEKVISFIAPQLGPIMKTKSFLRIKKETLATILAIENTGPIKEIEIFRGAMEWATLQCTLNQMTIDGPNKRQYLGDLVKLIRFPLLTVEELGQCIKEEKGLLTAEEEYGLLLGSVTKEQNNHGFSNEIRKILYKPINSNPTSGIRKEITKPNPISLDTPITSEIQKTVIQPKLLNMESLKMKNIEIFTGNQNWEWTQLSKQFSGRSKFSVNKAIYLYLIRPAVSELGQELVIQLSNDKFTILSQISHKVKSDDNVAFGLQHPIFIEPNRIYIIDIIYENSGCRFKLVNKKNVPWSKSKDEITLKFLELSPMLCELNFKGAMPSAATKNVRLDAHLMQNN